jgi:transcriptional regulator with XRE-family HTH domain
MKPRLNRLREERLRARLYQYELADRTGIHQTYLTLFETGRACPTEEQLARIAAVLDVAPAKLREKEVVRAS